MAVSQHINVVYSVYRRNFNEASFFNSNFNYSLLLLQGDKKILCIRFLRSSDQSRRTSEEPNILFSLFPKISVITAYYFMMVSEVIRRESSSFLLAKRGESATERESE